MDGRVSTAVLFAMRNYSGSIDG